MRCVCFVYTEMTTPRLDTAWGLLIGEVESQPLSEPSHQQLAAS